MAESREYATVVKHSKELEIALSSDTDILHFLNEEGFIGNNVYDEVCNTRSMMSPTEKSSIVVNAIRNKVNLNPQNYHKLLHHFRQNRRSYGHIADILDNEYMLAPQNSQRPTSNELTLRNIRIFLKDEGFSPGSTEELGIYLGIKPGSISTLRQNSGGDLDRWLSNVITQWLNNDSKKSWQKLATALRHCGYSVMADKIVLQKESEDSLELDENERKAIYDEAMRFGHIDVSIIKILIVGAGGVGKSCLLRFLCDLGILEKYSSTTLINTAQRVKCERVLTSKDDSSDEIKWELVGPEELKSVLADAIKSRAAKTSSPQRFNVESLQSSEPESTQTSSEPESTQTSLESISEVLGLLKYKGGKLFSVTWIYLVDSGGQPQFHELLTAFVRNATLGIFVLNLSEQLDDKPEIKYYKNGQPCGESYKFPLSHKEIFQHCVQTISSLCPINHSLPSTETEEPSTTSVETEEPTVTSEFIKPGILVVGTHRKGESKSKESREEKEEKLKEILQPYGTGIIKNAGKYIFPIDSISREKPDKDVRDEIRKGIAKAVKPFCEKLLPLQYYALELELDQQAKKEKRDVISFKGCFKKIGPSLNFSQKTFLAAIQHLDRLNLILYFKSQAPDVIFTNPNTLLDKVGEIVEKSYIWRGKVSPIKDQWVSDESIILINRGEVTLEVLKSFESSYIEGLFDHNTLTRILTHLFVLLPKTKDKYFMPALLDVNLDVTSPTKDYFAVSFPGNAPMGLFSSSVVCLLSKYKWEEMNNTPGHLFRNSLTFKVSIAQVTLLDRRTHFEVHIQIKDCFKKVLPKLRARIRDNVINAVNEVKEARHLYNLEYSSKCFYCPCSSSPPHLAKYKFSEDIDAFILDCTKDGGSFPVEEWHKEWLAPSMEDVTIEKEESEPTRHKTNTQLSRPSSSDHSPELPEGLIKRPQRSWQDKIPDARHGNDERETIRKHEDPVPSPSEKPRERYKFKDKRNPYGFVLVMIILFGVATGFIYIMNTNATTGSSVQEEPLAGPSTQPIQEEPSAGPSTTPTDPRKVKQSKVHRIKNLKDLISATEELGDWYGLCLSLRVDQAVMNQLDDSTERPLQKMRRCLMSYFNNRKPLWDDVVRAIAELHNKRLACRIAMEHMQWEEKDCEVELSM